MRYLVTIAIGPVQEFIAQARRSRDLWFGSHLLSELARACAKSLLESPNAESVELVSPILSTAELEPCDGMVRRGGLPPVSVSNKLVCAIEADAGQLDLIVKAARAASTARLIQLADRARDAAQGLLADKIESVWAEQLEKAIEFYVAAKPFTDETFLAVRADLDREIAGRKSLRDFSQDTHGGRPGAPKSSLDGGKVSVLRPSRERGDHRSRTAKSEHLDAVGVVKRCGGSPEQFVPVANVAFSPWLAQLDADVRQDAEEFAQQFGVVHRQTPAGEFRGDAQVFLDGRLKSLLDERYPGDARSQALERLKQATHELEAVLKAARPQGLGLPHPYVAVLVADGDRVGQRLDKLTSMAEHQRFSRELSEFATAARHIVDSSHSGSLLFAGGDDVIGFVPISEAVGCADDLQVKFAEAMARALPGVPDDERPTLSVGVGVGHVLTGMGDLLDIGRAAEKLAKGDTLPTDAQRNAFAIVLDKRSGGRIEWRRSWMDDAKELVEMACARVAKGEESATLPLTKLQQVRTSLRRFEAAPAAGVLADEFNAEWQPWLEPLRMDVTRTLKRAGQDDMWAAFGLPTWPENYSEARRAMDDWVALHLIAKELNAGNTTAPPGEVDDFPQVDGQENEYAH